METLFDTQILWYLIVPAFLWLILLPVWIMIALLKLTNALTSYFTTLRRLKEAERVEIERNAAAQKNSISKAENEDKYKPR